MDSRTPGWLQRLHTDSEDWVTERLQVRVPQVEAIRPLWWWESFEIQKLTGARSWVYWLCDDDGKPLYIGRSSDLRHRLTQHERRASVDTEWAFNDVRLFPCGSDMAAEHLERRMIDTHNLARNIQRWPVLPLDVDLDFEKR